MPSGASTLGGDAEEPLVLAWLFPRTDGPMLELDAGARSSGTGEAVIGRDADCTVVLPGEDVSRRHALVRGGREPVITDLKSRNGTFVNGERVSSSALRYDDVVRIGGWVGVVTRGAGPLGSLAPGLYAGSQLSQK